MTEQNYGLIRDGVGVASLKQCPIPYLPDDYILVKTVAIALNPTDSATLDGPGDNGTLVGCDYAGTVVEVGKDVKRPFKKGDRIAGFSHGGQSFHLRIEATKLTWLKAMTHDQLQEHLHDTSS